MPIKINNGQTTQWECHENENRDYEAWQQKAFALVDHAKKSGYTLDYTAGELQKMIQENPEYAAKAGLPTDGEGVRKFLIVDLGFVDQREVYQCERPLKHIPGKGKKNGPDTWLNPVYHQYTCVETAPDSHQYNCQGLGVKNLIQGKMESDEYNGALCKKVIKDDAYAGCIKEKWEESPPYYWVNNFVPNGLVENCQAYDDRINKECAKKEN